MKYIYLYIKNELVEECLKYGMKLSEFSNKVLTTSDNSTKSGIVAFLSPYDSELYYDDSYTCLKIATANINCYIFNETCIYDKKYLMIFLFLLKITILVALKNLVLL